MKNESSSQLSTENNTSLPTILFYDIIVDKAHLNKLWEITSHDFKEGHTRCQSVTDPLMKLSTIQLGA